MDTASVEEGLPFLYDLLEEGILSKSEVTSIVRQRKKYEAKLLSPSSTTVVDRYVAFEKMNESKIVEKNSTPYVSSYFSNYIEKIYLRFLRKNPGCLEKWKDYILLCLTRKRHKSCLKGITQALKFLPLSEELACFCARILTKDFGSFSQGRNILRNSLGKFPNSASLWEAIVELELELLILLRERKTALGQNNIDSSFSVIKTILEAMEGHVSSEEYNNIKALVRTYPDASATLIEQKLN